LRVKSRVNGASSHNRLLYFSELVNRLQAKLNVDTPLIFNDVYWSAYFLEMSLPEGLEPLLRKLRHLSVQLAVVTDHVADLQIRKLRVLELEKQFDYVVTSEECSGEKATLEPFKLLFERIESKEFDCIWFIGDELQDWPNVEQGNEKKYLASPFTRKAPRDIKKIYNYIDLHKLV
jgi:FMN phosphatase YigB (HAD superfamily)